MGLTTFEPKVVEYFERNTKIYKNLQAFHEFTDKPSKRFNTPVYGLFIRGDIQSCQSAALIESKFLLSELKM